MRNILSTIFFLAAAVGLLFPEIMTPEKVILMVLFAIYWKLEVIVEDTKNI